MRGPSRRVMARLVVWRPLALRCWLWRWLAGGCPARPRTGWATGSVTSEEAAETLREGDRIVRKPFQPSELRDAVHDALLHRRPQPS
jgi:hypothetical protein